MLSPEVLAELDSLLASARAKESQALDTLISKSLPHMRKYLRDPSPKLSPSLSEADEDVLKDAAARVALKFSSFEGKSAPEFLSWLKKIVVRRKIDSLRKQGRKKRRDDALSRTTTEEHATALAAQTPASRTSERMDAIETWLTVLSALLELPTKQREAFWLCVICERDREEIATRLGGTRGSIAGDINRARSALADVLRAVQQAEQSVPPERPLVGGMIPLPVERLRLAGRFDVGHLLSDGDVAHLYSGFDVWTNQPVAIRMLQYRYCTNPESVARFINEAHWLRTCSSEHVSQILSGGMLPGGRPYLVQQWLPISLAAVLKKGPLQAKAARYVLRHVCRAIAVLHARGLIHRDISPAQFRMVRWEVDDKSVPREQIRLASLALAKPVGEHNERAPLPVSTSGGVLPGDWEYRAPETWVNAKYADVRTDIYGIGALWFALRTGHPPFVKALDESLQSLMQRCLYHQPPLTEVEEASPLLIRSLSKDPSSRPTLTELHDEFERD